MSTLPLLVSYALENQLILSLLLLLPQVLLTLPELLALYLLPASLALLGLSIFGLLFIGENGGLVDGGIGDD